MYPASYINNNGNNSFSTINQQWITSSCNYNHENPNFNPIIMQSINEKSSNNNGKFIAADTSTVNCFSSSHVILENNRLTGNRSSKKDRHSKINTARGPRDRRMRLSIDVATKFFRLQDLLKFGKASNTIEWLLEKSKPAIRDLRIQQLNQRCSFMDLSSSPSSECEVVSGIDDHQSMEKTDEVNIKQLKKNKIEKRRVRKSVYIDHSVAKETREKARARARKRTTEKKLKVKLLDNYDQVGAGCHQFSKLRPSLDHQIIIDQNTTRLGFWIPFGDNQVQLTDQAAGYPNSKQGVVGDSSSMLSAVNWSTPPFLIGYQHNPGINFS